MQWFLCGNFNSYRWWEDFSSYTHTCISTCTCTLCISYPVKWNLMSRSINFEAKWKKKYWLEMLGFEPRTFCMQSRRSTTELHPHSHKCPPQCGIVDAHVQNMTCTHAHIQMYILLRHKAITLSIDVGIAIRGYTHPLAHRVKKLD